MNLGNRVPDTMPLRFAERFGVNARNMFCFALRRNDHNLISAKMRSLIRTGIDYSTLSRSYIIRKHIQAYDELYRETGDELWKFLREFVKDGQVTP